MDKQMSKYEKEVKEYFSSKAQDYDEVEKQKYWQLSDNLMWFLLKENLDKLPENFIFLDAGGGTGRWSKKILESYPKCRGMLIDLSKDMLAEAEKKNNFGERWEILNEDLQNLNLQNNTFDIVINTHNVLGFVENSKKAILEMSRVLKKTGILISVIPNLYHGMFFNILQNNLDGAKKLNKSHKGKFVDNMPKIEMFTPETIKELYKKANINNIKCYGFPVLIYPGYQETQLYGESQQAKDILSNNIEKLYELEKSLIKNENLACRGNNLFVIGKKL